MLQLAVRRSSKRKKDATLTNFAEQESQVAPCTAGHGASQSSAALPPDECEQQHHHHQQQQPPQPEQHVFVPKAPPPRFFSKAFRRSFRRSTESAKPAEQQDCPDEETRPTESTDNHGLPCRKKKGISSAVERCICAMPLGSVRQIASVFRRLPALSSRAQSSRRLSSVVPSKQAGSPEPVSSSCWQPSTAAESVPKTPKSARPEKPRSFSFTPRLLRSR